MGSPSPSPRQVAVCLIVLSSGLHSVPSFLIVSSRKHKDPLKWVLPKGGIEHEESSQQAAAREAWEEAGVIPSQSLHLTHLLTLPDAKPHSKSPAASPSSPSFIPSTTYSFELFAVSSSSDSEALAAEWPEKDERQRRWVEGWDELEKMICWGRREEVMRKAIDEAKTRLG
ncbi:NUDIX hydrolase domain-like protein [Leucosporidium creatinivorum]|uniref:NUDIX hydrolase domain-like protein n=1 Tax=Leucosporidium creatinivorum TaxID=106004 RepID=A0A1Y2G275_9BASI|nr:NUDIX hydrolase domain-like protein [Leucosporidium creatinivorum]